MRKLAVFSGAFALGVFLAQVLPGTAWQPLAAAGCLAAAVLALALPGLWRKRGLLALCALSDGPVGADLEVIRPRRPGLPAYVLQGGDYDRYLALGGDWPAFYALWTERESIVKYTGEGLRAWRQAAPPAGCVMTSFHGEGWVAAVCGRERARPAPGQPLTPWR